MVEGALKQLDRAYECVMACLAALDDYFKHCGVLHQAKRNPGDDPPIVLDEGEIEELARKQAELRKLARRGKAAAKPVEWELAAENAQGVAVKSVKGASWSEAVLDLTEQLASKLDWREYPEAEDRMKNYVFNVIGNAPQDIKLFQANVKNEVAKVRCRVGEEGVVEKREGPLGSVNSELERSWGKETDAVRALKDQPQRFLILLIDHRGQVVKDRVITKTVCLRVEESESRGAVFRARNRLRVALRKAGFGELDKRILRRNNGYGLDLGVHT